jgi:hypothetical protein
VTMTKGPTQQGSAWAQSNPIPIRDVAVQVEVVAADGSSGVESIHANEAEPRSEDRTGGDALAPRSWGLAIGLGGEHPGLSPPRGAP